MIEVNRPIVVLKFGSSVLRGRDMHPEVVSEIYRVERTGRRVVAVTSAFMGVTGALLHECIRLGCAHDNVNAPGYIATGEAKYDDPESKLAAAPVISVPTITLEGVASAAPHPPSPIGYAGKFWGKYASRIIASGIGHILPQEEPRAFAQAIVDVAAM